MNKSILIVICDFLLLSMISLLDFGDTSAKQESAPQEAEVVQAFSDSQLVDLLKMSLEKEKDRREQLDQNLGKLSEAVQKSAELSEQQKKMLAAREREIAALAKTKTDLEKEKQQIVRQAQSLEQRVATIDERNATLQTQIVSASQKLEKSAAERMELEKKLGDMRQVDSSSQAKLKALQEELKLNKENLESLRAQSEKLQNENRAMDAEKRALATQLEVASTKTQIYEENLKRAQALVDIEKSEKKKMQEHADVLAVGVGELAASHEKLGKNIEQLRPQTASEIFESVKDNLVSVSIKYTRKGLFGTSEDSDEVRCLPFFSADRAWLVFPTNSTIFAPTPNHPASIPETLSITVFGKMHKFSPKNFLGVMQEARLVAIPVPAEFIEKEKLRTFELTPEAFKFSESVIIDPKRLYYGQTPFKVDRKMAGYAQMDTGLFEAIFGDFSPSTGDIVMSRSGEFLGYMVNSSNAVLFREFTTLNSIGLGAEYNKAAYESFMTERANRVRGLNPRLK